MQRGDARVADPERIHIHFSCWIRIQMLNLLSTNFEKKYEKAISKIIVSAFENSLK